MLKKEAGAQDVLLFVRNENGLDCNVMFLNFLVVEFLLRLSNVIVMKLVILLNFFLAVDHEPFVGLNSNLVCMLSIIFSMCWIKVKVIQLRVKVKLACQSFTSVSGYN